MDPLEPVRIEVAERFRRLLSGGREPAKLAEWVTDEGDDGLFGPDSAAWQVHGELATLIGGLRALLLQTLHPLAMELGGISELEPALQKILDTAVDAQDADRGLVWLQDPASGRLVAAASNGFSPEALDDFRDVIREVREK